MLRTSKGSHLGNLHFGGLPFPGISVRGSPWPFPPPSNVDCRGFNDLPSPFPFLSLSVDRALVRSRWTFFSPSSGLPLLHRPRGLLLRQPFPLYSALPSVSCSNLTVVYVLYYLSSSSSSSRLERAGLPPLAAEQSSNNANAALEHAKAEDRVGSQRHQQEIERSRGNRTYLAKAIDYSNNFFFTKNFIQDQIIVRIKNPGLEVYIHNFLLTFFFVNNKS